MGPKAPPFLPWGPRTRARESYRVPIMRRAFILALAFIVAFPSGVLAHGGGRSHTPRPAAKSSPTPGKLPAPILSLGDLGAPAPGVQPGMPLVRPLHVENAPVPSASQAPAASAPRRAGRAALQYTGLASAWAALS